VAVRVHVGAPAVVVAVGEEGRDVVAVGVDDAD